MEKVTYVTKMINMQNHLFIPTVSENTLDLIKYNSNIVKQLLFAKIVQQVLYNNYGNMTNAEKRK